MQKDISQKEEDIGPNEKDNLKQNEEQLKEDQIEQLSKNEISQFLDQKVKNVGFLTKNE